METYTILKDRQDNKWCSLKNFDQTEQTKWDGGSNTYKHCIKQSLTCEFLKLKRALQGNSEIWNF